ncbi:MAG: hypothetical protein LBK58_02675 [Prevotellaceae bacterium]|jgi:hypothetical protein|nr:hypothetical protein [Prevotellaceae bacterium]
MLRLCFSSCPALLIKLAISAAQDAYTAKYCHHPVDTEFIFPPYGGKRQLISRQQRYDYVFLDTTLLRTLPSLRMLRGMTIFVVRKGLFDRCLLPELEQIYRSGKFPNMAILLNGSSMSPGKYYGGYSRYGHAYGWRERLKTEMFFRRKYSIAESRLLQGMVDIIFFMMDDGMQTEKETFAALDCLEEQGVQTEIQRAESN